AAWPVREGRSHRARPRESARQIHQTSPHLVETRPAMKLQAAGRECRPGRAGWESARASFRGESQRDRRAAHHDKSTEVPSFFRCRRSPKVFPSVASWQALYAIGRRMELLLLTVCSDVSILPPLLNLSPLIHDTQSFIAVPRRSRCSPRAHRSLSSMNDARRRFLMSGMLTLAVAGCQKLSLRSQNPDEDDVKPPETEYIKD